MAKIVNTYFNWNDIEDEARLSAMRHGLAVRRQDPNTNRSYFENLSITLFPSNVDRNNFNLAMDMQLPINAMMNNIGNDHNFVKTVLNDLLQVDEFTSKLYNIDRKIRKEGIAADHALGLFRSDYIIDKYNLLKQVEINAISVGFAGLAPSIEQFHRYTMKQFKNYTDTELDEAIPKNESLKNIAQALIDSHQIYGKSNSAILVVIEKNVINIMDQKAIEWKIRELSNDSIRIHRRAFHELDNHLFLGPNKELMLNIVNNQNQVQETEISIVYFRTAYSPIDFEYENSWDIRLLIEQSRAIKCPSAAFQLAGVKKFQSVLNDETILKKYINVEYSHLMNNIWKTFMPFYPVNDANLKLLDQKPLGFVLKPNREGGGNNYFGYDVRPKYLKIMESDEAKAYTLMEYIDQPTVNGYILKPSSKLVEQQPGIEIKTELGVFGAILASTKTNELKFNRNIGHLLRSKTATSDETGVMAGDGALDSPYLTL